MPTIRLRALRFRRWRLKVFLALGFITLLALVGRGSQDLLRASCSSESLPNLTANVLTSVSHALALVRLGRAGSVDAGRKLADGLLIRSVNAESRRFAVAARLCGLNVNFNARRNLENGRMTEPDRQRQLLALKLDGVTDPVNFQLFAVAPQAAFDHVGYQAAA